MDPRVHFLIFPPGFNRCHRRSIDNKSPMDRRVYFLISPLAFNEYLRRNIGNKFSVDLRSAPLGF